MKISLRHPSGNGSPLRRLKSRLSRPYDKLRGGLRFLTIYDWHDHDIYHDVHHFLTGEPSVADLHTHGNEADFRRHHFSFPRRGTQLEEIVNEVFVHRIYEGFGARIHDGDVVLDCGANIGLFALYALERIGSAGRIICIEPVPETYELLVGNVVRSNLARSQQFFPLNLALSDRNETRVFLYSEERSGSATGCVERFDIARGEGDYKEFEVRCTSIDQIVLHDLKTTIDFIKMDVEGMEKEAIVGARKTIREFKPRFVISPHFDSNEIVRALREIRSDYKIINMNNIVYAW